MARRGTRADSADEKHHLAKVRVAGSNPAFRSIGAGQRAFSGHSEEGSRLVWSRAAGDVGGVERPEGPSLATRASTSGLRASKSGDITFSCGCLLILKHHTLRAARASVCLPGGSERR